MKLWAWFEALFLLAASTAPLGQGATPGKGVTLVAVDVPLETALPRLAELGGVRLTWDACVGNTRVTIGVHACPLSDVMAALAAATGVTWVQLGEGQFHLRAPAISPAVMETSALITKLATAYPSWMKSRSDAVPADARRRKPPMDVVYGSLHGTALDVLEEGGEVDFARLPARARSALTDYVRQSAAAKVSAALHPAWWGVPAEFLGLRLSKIGFGGRGITWEVVTRAPAGPWHPVTTIPYQPVSSPTADGRLSPGDPQTVADAALSVSARADIGVVIREGGNLAARDPAGTTAQELLNSLLPEGGTASFFRCSWQRVGKVYWLAFGPAGERPADTPELEKYRRLLAAAVPGEYRMLFAMDARQRSLGLGSMWAKLWQSLAWEQQTAGEPLPVSELTREQRDQLLAALQAQMVERVWSVLEESLGDDLRRSSVSLDFEMVAYARRGRLGVPRILSVREGERVLLLGEINQAPLLLRLLPSGEVALQKRVDLIARDQPLHAVLADVSKALNAPVVVEELQQEARLTGDFHRRPLLLVLHWVERKTGLVWCKAAGAYVLAAPVPMVAVARDARRGASVLGQGLRKPVAAGPGGGVTEAVTDQDRALLEAGAARLHELSPALRVAIENRLAAEAQLSLGSVQTSWETLNRLTEARISLTPMRLGAGGDQRFLRIQVPGLAPVSLPAPSQGQSR